MLFEFKHEFLRISVDLKRHYQPKLIIVLIKCMYDYRDNSVKH
jgi:hypothetical protein